MQHKRARELSDSSEEEGDAEEKVALAEAEGAEAER